MVAFRPCGPWETCDWRWRKLHSSKGGVVSDDRRILRPGAIFHALASGRPVEFFVHHFCSLVADLINDNTSIYDIYLRENLQICKNRVGNCPLLFGGRVGWCWSNGQGMKNHHHGYIWCLMRKALRIGCICG